MIIGNHGIHLKAVLDVKMDAQIAFYYRPSEKREVIIKAVFWFIFSTIVHNLKCIFGKFIF